ncbi:hypothetical protein Patl1_11691 [Pistacia atlantica]|uniref:Uncharacterized protein n=1 Tax=Pistacia atlantica TaxID=434234 RepID=A0ACC1A3E5_9ROSI|nr:hypothetical protein Patl1_11691 [Pistacia atlantica]
MHNEEEWKGTSAPDIDLSYNYLSGTFPSWVSTGSKQLNLVANNFTFESSNISSLLGLNCLQRNFLCNKNAPACIFATADSSFAIKCGGEEMKVDIIVCEADGYDLGGASCIVLDTAKLAISGAGPKLYQSSRQSSGSLRFYGLRLENGLHNVSLSFAETVFGDQGSQKWMSLGRRVFDIYIQLKDFDISTRAGGERKAITNKFNANVSENYLEIHLLWAGKGTCSIADAVLLGIGPKLKIFSYAELRSATQDFDCTNKLGQGGFGPL